MEIKTISPGIYQVNGKVVDTNIPIWGKELTNYEYHCLIDYREDEVDSAGNFVNYTHLKRYV